MTLTISQIPEPITVWEKVEILTSADPSAGLYNARIEDFVEGGIIVSQPELIKGSMLLRDNCEVFMHITKADAVYRFISTIKKTKINGQSLYFLAKPKFIKRIQRREFARLDYSTVVEYTEFHDCYTEKQEWNKSFSVNISGNGILIGSKGLIKKDSFVLLKIQLFKDLDLKFPVIGKTYRAFIQNNTYYSGIGFMMRSEISRIPNRYPHNKLSKISHNYDTAAQEKLISFVFIQQIEQRKRGLI